MQCNHPDDVHLLDTQYRMHPDISYFASRAFYDGKLRDGPDMAKIRRKPWHASTILGPYRFFDVQGQHHTGPSGHSLVNVAEVKVALQLYERLRSDYGGYDFSGQIGIITPYKSQLRELRLRFSQQYTDKIFEQVDFNTTDAFQGREAEIIIFSCVRAASSGIGFLSDIRRMNVGLTRAKCSLWVLGNVQSLMQGEFWAELITQSRSRNLLTQGNILKLLKQPSIKDKSNTSDGDDVEMDDLYESKTSIESREDSTDNASGTSGKPAGQRNTNASPNNAKSFNSRPMPSGGSNGLDSTKNCSICGSYNHMAKECDNEDAKIARGKFCDRCGDPNHISDYCDETRCMDCGDFGHETKACVSTKMLSSAQKEDLARREKGFSIRRRDREKRAAMKQMKGHDEKVPMVKVTRKTPPLDDRGLVIRGSKGPREGVPADSASRQAGPSKGMGQRNGKRGREPSPPSNLEVFKPSKVSI
jgi:senataxin